MTWPPVSVAISCSMALRRSPKPGALTAATFRPPRSLLTTSVASAIDPEAKRISLLIGARIAPIGADLNGARSWREFETEEGCFPAILLHFALYA